MLNEHSGATTGLHIFTAKSKSGITAYARDFHDMVLAPAGYVQADPDAILNPGLSLTANTRCHVQLGVFQHRERLAMTKLIDNGYRVEATIHDPPFLTFPYFQFQSRLAMRLSRGFDWYLGALSPQRRVLEQLHRIFVLSEQGRKALLRLAPRANVVTIPHIVRRDQVWPAGSPVKPALIHFGFIGPNKGVEYALNVHRTLNRLRPGTHLHVIGKASGNTGRQYLERLRAEYDRDVTFHGYVADDLLDALFGLAGHVILPYAPSKHIVPTSGSVVHALRRGRVVWTTNANAMSEMIQDGKNGFMLSMNVERDAHRLAAVMHDENLVTQISIHARQSAVALAEYAYSRHFNSI